MKRNVEKLYVKWKGYKNWFNTWVDKKDIVKMNEYFPKIKIFRISDVVENDVVKEDVYNAKIKSIKDQIPDITDLASNTILTLK